MHSSHSVATHFSVKVHFCIRCGHQGPPGGKSPGLRVPCNTPTRNGKQALRNIRRNKWPSYKGKKGKPKKLAQTTQLGLGRFARLFRHRRIQAALGRAVIMPAPSLSMSRPSEAGGHPGPSIPESPGRFPLHQGQLGWNMLLPCEACIALAFPGDASHPNKDSEPTLKKAKLDFIGEGILNMNQTSVPSFEQEQDITSSNATGSTFNNSPKEVGAPGISQGAASVETGVGQQSAAPRSASSGYLEQPSQGSAGVPPPPPPPPPPIACFRHRGGRGWSLSNLCEACLQLAFDADLG